MNTQHYPGDSNAPTTEDKRLRLLAYLAEVAKTRMSVIRDVRDFEQVIWLADIPRTDGCFVPGREEQDDGETCWLEVSKPNTPAPECPPVPILCKAWLKDNTDLPLTTPPGLHTQITRDIPNPEAGEQPDAPPVLQEVCHIQDAPEVSAAWEDYLKNQWQPWLAQYNTWQQMKSAYTALYNIHQSLKKQGETLELVLGLGLLSWSLPDSQIYRHAVIANAELMFEPSRGKFTVTAHNEGAKLRLDTDIFAGEERPATVDNDLLEQQLNAAQDNPWQTQAIDKTLRSLVQSLGTDGHYDQTMQRKPSQDKAPYIQYAPALILRKRSDKSYLNALQEICRQISEEDTVPDQFSLLADAPADEQERFPKPLTNNAVNQNIFFPKPANEAQYRIIEKMAAGNGVLVQGPPGTGKSHTIANLICHLLATGQRILITARSSNALKVLESHIPPELRPLCINLLGEGNKQKESLERSINGILSRQDCWQEATARQNISALEQQYQQLRAEQATLEQHLAAIHAAENQTIHTVAAHYQGTIAEIAATLDMQRRDYGWLRESVAAITQDCPLTSAQLHQWLHALRCFDAEKRAVLQQSYPETLPSSAEFSRLSSEEAESRQAIAQSPADETLTAQFTSLKPEEIFRLQEALHTFITSYRALNIHTSDWKSRAVNDIFNNHSALWQEGLRLTQQATSLQSTLQQLDDSSLTLPAEYDLKTICTDAGILQQYLAKGGSLGFYAFLRPKIVRERDYLLDKVKINGQACTDQEALQQLTDMLQAQLICSKATAFWARYNVRIDGAFTLQFAELHALEESLNDILIFADTLAVCRSLFQQHPALNMPVWSDSAQIQALSLACQQAYLQKTYAVVQQQLDAVAKLTACHTGEDNPHPVNAQLYQAVKQRDHKSYTACLKQIAELNQERSQLACLENQLQQAAEILPETIAALCATANDPEWTARINALPQALQWARAGAWLDKQRCQEDVTAMETRVRQIEQACLQITAELASWHAWSRCFAHLQEQHRSHMISWQRAMKKLGKGTGKYAAQHRKDAQYHMNACREGVPAWIMPLERIWDTVRPAQHIFDVIIVDEASQCDLKALPLFYLGKKILIIGDDKQTSPEAVGINQSTIRQLQDEYLYDFKFKSDFDVQSSLFDHARIYFARQQNITLREHFRCMPEIIAFSNRLCYADTPLIPLRQYSSERLAPLERIFVSTGRCDENIRSAVNRPEAEAVVEKILSICQDSRYTDKTIGVITLQGNTQARVIEEQLLERLGMEEIEQRKIICGEPANFQGDERDIILLSMVIAPNKRFRAVTSENDKRRFNVAASRARDQMILVHSVALSDLNPECYRAKLLAFFSQPPVEKPAPLDPDALEHHLLHDNRDIISPPAPFAHWFEAEVALILLRRQYRICLHETIADYCISIVVEGTQARLALECDGFAGHDPEQYDKDIQRRRQLQRCGWTFIRLRAAAFYADKEKALVPLWEMLQMLDIQPVAPCTDGD